jgi:hypothetical protein
MVNILHKVGVKASTPGAFYKALTTMDGLCGWWTTQTAGNGSVGSVIEFRFGLEAST